MVRMPLQFIHRQALTSPKPDTRSSRRMPRRVRRWTGREGPTLSSCRASTARSRAAQRTIPRLSNGSACTVRSYDISCKVSFRHLALSCVTPHPAYTPLHIRAFPNSSVLFSFRFTVRHFTIAPASRAAPASSGHTDGGFWWSRRADALVLSAARRAAGGRTESSIQRRLVRKGPLHRRPKSGPSQEHKPSRPLCRPRQDDRKALGPPRPVHQADSCCKPLSNRGFVRFEVRSFPQRP